MTNSPPHSQCSYDYENRAGCENVSRHASSKDMCISQRSTIDSTDDVGEAYEDLYLLQEIAFDLPEMEGILLNTMSNMKHRNSFAFPAWFVEIFMASVHFVVMAAFIFLIGFIASFFMTTPTGFTGSVIWASERGKNEPIHKLFLVEDDPNNTLSLEGTLYLSHHVLNPTPFTASLSSLVSVYYLPRSDKSAQSSRMCLAENSWQNTAKVTELLKNPNEGIFKSADVIQPDLSFPGRHGSHAEENNEEHAQDDADDDPSCEDHSLVTLREVKRVKKHVYDLPLRIKDNSFFDAFTSYSIFSNNLHVITNVEPGLNEVSYLISINEKIPQIKETEKLRQLLLNDCQHGNLLLRLTSTDQRFETMFFGGDMLPQKFFPVSVPCQVTQKSQWRKDIAAVRREQSEAFAKQFALLLNMDTIYNPRCPLYSSENEDSHG
ncbi:hypothetical protein BaOVIS_024580 [Babesia ovis]|uniref:Uncharacterized protein n=1 Tax=Babesia ovis TaxID=5869 RepID=A0A9W5TBA2_BABOV|nr:hypothetical protein BaOVIS_024580 [Babesia ovis]